MIKELYIEFISQKPKFYAQVYMGLIINFSVVYFFLPGLIVIEGGNIFEHIIKSFYFSVITITTLGYGDISPSTWYGQLATALEAILGIIMIGLFLNALSHQHSTFIEKSEFDTRKEAALQLKLKHILRVDAILRPQIQKYLAYSSALYSGRCPPEAAAILKKSPSELTEVFEPPCYPLDKAWKPCLSYYYESLGELKATIENPLVANKLTDWEQIEELLISISSSYINDVREGLLEKPHEFRKSFIETVKKFDEITSKPDFKMQGNILYYFHVLHENVIFTAAQIQTYDKLIRELKEKYQSLHIEA